MSPYEALNRTFPAGASGQNRAQRYCSTCMLDNSDLVGPRNGTDRPTIAPGGGGIRRVSGFKGILRRCQSGALSSTVTEESASRWGRSLAMEPSER
jgi:hypothetical protein